MCLSSSIGRSIVNGVQIQDNPIEPEIQKQCDSSRLEDVENLNVASSFEKSNYLVQHEHKICRIMRILT